MQVNASEISNNKYGAGLRVFGGAGKMFITTKCVCLCVCACDLFN